MQKTLYRETLINEGRLEDLHVLGNGKLSLWLKDGKRSVFVDGVYIGEKDKDRLSISIFEKDKTERTLYLKGTFGMAPYAGTGDNGAFVLIPGFRGHVVNSTGFADVNGKDLTDSTFYVAIGVWLLSYKGDITLSEAEDE